jgi:hypothetical protein
MSKRYFRRFCLFTFLIINLLVEPLFADQKLSEEQVKELETSGRQEQLLLDGDVELSWKENCLVSGCRGQGCDLHIDATVVEDRIYVVGSVGMCDHSGNCAACIPSQTSITLTNLPKGEYKVFTSTSTDPFSFGRFPKNLPEINN